jgi:hypothetical protein
MPAIPIDMSSDEFMALAQLVKRIDYETCKRFASPNTTYGNRSDFTSHVRRSCSDWPRRRAPLP